LWKFAKIGKNLFFNSKILYKNKGALIPVCMIYGNKIAVKFKAIVGGPILDVCEDCLKKHECKKIEVTDVYKILRLTYLRRIINIGD
jgi:hypothetical protein